MQTKKIIATVAAGLLMSVCVQAQTEPEFVGSVFLLMPDSTTIQLERQNAVGGETTNAASYVPYVGLFAGKTKTMSKVEGVASPVRVSAGTAITLIMRVGDNTLDPTLQLSVFKLEQKKTFRFVETAQYTLTSTTQGKIQYFPFTAKKFGQSSYIVTLTGLGAGEYAVIQAGSVGMFHLFGVNSL